MCWRHANEQHYLHIFAETTIIHFILSSFKAVQGFKNWPRASYD